MILTEDEQTYLRKRLHSPAMQCQQCALILRLLEADEAK